MRATLRQLEYAVSLADRLHFGRAAAACGVSQPALSLQIKQLEETLGAVLFERNRRRVLLTDLGASVVGRARGILSEMESLRSLAARSGPLTGALRLGADATIAPYLLPLVLPEVRREFPGLRLHLEVRRAGRLIAPLESGELDLLLTSLPVDVPGVRGQGLIRERLVAALPPRHELAASEVVRVEDLGEFPALHLEEGHSLRVQTLELCPRSLPKVCGTDLGSIVQMVANGLGPAILPALAVPVEAPPGTGVEIRPFARPSPAREIGLVWRKGSPRESEFRLLGRLLRPG